MYWGLHRGELVNRGALKGVGAAFGGGWQSKGAGDAEGDDGGSSLHVDGWLVVGMVPSEMVEELT